MVRDARKSQGMTLSELASRSSCSVSSLFELETNGLGTVALMERVVKALDLKFVGLPGHGPVFERLRLRRESLRLTKSEVAAHAGISPDALARLERGEARIATMERVAKRLAPKLRPRAPEISRYGGGVRNERLTDHGVWERIEKAIGVSPIDLDPCGHVLSPVRARRRYSVEDDGLKQQWVADWAYVNPPYAFTAAFIAKAVTEWQADRLKNAILLLPANTQLAVFHDKLVGNAEILLLRSRLQFLDETGQRLGKIPFGHYIAMLGGTGEILDRLMAGFPSVHLPKDARRTSG